MVLHFRHVGFQSDSGSLCERRSSVKPRMKVVESRLKTNATCSESEKTGVSHRPSPTQ